MELEGIHLEFNTQLFLKIIAMYEILGFKKTRSFGIIFGISSFSGASQKNDP